MYSHPKTVIHPIPVVWSAGIRQERTGKLLTTDIQIEQSTEGYVL